MTEAIEENPAAWGAEPVNLDPRSWGAEPVQPDEIPQAFTERVKRGWSLSAILDRAYEAGKEGFGEEPVGYGWEAMNKARRDLQNYRILPNPDYLSEHPFSLPALGNAIFEAGAHGADWGMRAFNAGIYGAAGAAGHVIGEHVGSEAARADLDRDLMMMGQMSFIAAGMAPREPTFVRHGPDMRLEVVGTAPKSQDFSNAAISLSGAEPALPRLGQLKSEAAAEERQRLVPQEWYQRYSMLNRRRGRQIDLFDENRIAQTNMDDLWRTQGITPMEAAHDAQTDTFLKADLTHESPEPSDRSGIPPAQGSHVHDGTPRTELAATGNPSVDAILRSDLTKKVIDDPVIDRTGDVSEGAAIADDGTVRIDRNIPQTVTTGGVTYDPADPLIARATVERNATDLLTQGGMDVDAAARVAKEYGQQAERAWYRSHGIETEELGKPFATDAELTQAGTIRDKSEIASRVTDAFVDAGRPAEEADLLGRLAGARYQVRSERLNGAYGTPLEMFEGTGFEVRPGEEGATPEGRTLEQRTRFKKGVRGAIEPLLKEGLSPEEIAKQTGYSIAAVKQIAKTPGKSMNPRWDEYIASIKGKTTKQFNETSLSDWFIDTDGALTRRLSQTGEGGELRGRIAISDSQKIMQIFKSADASTGIHEFGHMWVEEVLSDADLEGAPARLKSDAIVIRRSVGRDAMAEDGSFTAPLTNAEHEQLARQFEQYLRRGTAPSEELKGVFERFKQWLVEIYRTVKDNLGPVLKSDLRDVFDRILASDEEIAAARLKKTRMGQVIDQAQKEPDLAKQSEALAAVLTDRGGSRSGLLDDIMTRKEPLKGDATPEELAQADSIVSRASTEGALDQGVAGADITLQQRARPSEENLSLTRYLVANGGIKPTSDLLAIFGDKNPFIPGYGRLFRKNGKAIDLVAKEDVGDYLGANVSVRDLTRAIQDETRGKLLYRAGRERETAIDEQHEEYIIGQEMDHAFEREGFPVLEGESREKVLDLLRKGKYSDPFSAFEHVALEQGRDELGDKFTSRVPEHIPGWDVPEIPAAAPRTREGSAQEGNAQGAGVGEPPRQAGEPGGEAPPAGAGTAGPAGAEVTSPENLPSFAEQPPPRPGVLVGRLKELGTTFMDVGRDIQMRVAPMAVGGKHWQAIAKDFANTLRRNRWEWNRYDNELMKSQGLKAARERLGETQEEQFRRMWNAADEESVARQLGENLEHQGLATLEPEEKAIIDDLQARAQLAWSHAVDAGMVTGEGLPAYTPRMLVNVSESGRVSALPLNALGLNLKTRTGQMLRREHMTAEETEAAAKAKFGEETEIARNIRALAMATGKLEDAVAGRTMINQIEALGIDTGENMVAVGFRPGPDWFRIEHPAFYKWRPRMDEISRRPLLDENGDVVYDKVPIYMRGDAEGPMRSVLTTPSSNVYSAMMSLKAKTMSAIMYSPAIHNLVEWGRAFPAMGLRMWGVYSRGNRAKNDIGLMTEAIDAGLVPIGKRFFNQDIASIMEQPNLTPGRSWTSQVLSAAPDLFDPRAGDVVRRSIDAMGDFWHNTLLWDRVADLQMGIYTTMRGDMLRKGMDQQTAARVAAHLANRYAGALPMEAMSQGATKVANFVAFSRTFTIGNLGVLKDMATGLPRDVLAQIERDQGLGAAQQATAFARRKAQMTVALDVMLAYVGYQIFQVASNVLQGDSTLDEEMHGYVKRFQDVVDNAQEHPSSLLMPFDVVDRLSATSANEPGLQDRVRIGYMADGTAIYARNPVGKIGEEFRGWFSSPIDMLRRKEGTLLSPMLQVFANDQGFGRKIYDPNAQTPAANAENIWNVVKFFAEKQLPTQQIQAAHDLVTGEGDKKYNALTIGLPLVGVTVRKGAPGGPAVGELYHDQEMHRYQVDKALPDIRKQIQNGDLSGAVQKMQDLGIPGPLQQFYLRTTLNPATRVSGKALRDLYQYATPAQLDRIMNAPHQ